MKERVNENNELTLQLELWPFHLDFDGRYPLNQLVTRMIHTAGNHAAYFGFGIHAMLERGMTWMLSRMTIDFSKPITISQPLTISTGIISWSGLTTSRAIRISQGSDSVAEAMSSWVAIDVRRRMPVPIEEVLKDHTMCSKYPGVLLPDVPKRLWGMEIQEKLTPTHQHIVRYSDLDINRHVNSSVWVSLAMDAIPLNWIRERTIKRAHLRFVKEARDGDILEVQRYCKDEIDYLQISCDDATYFQLMIEWSSK